MRIILYLAAVLTISGAQHGDIQAWDGAKDLTGSWYGAWWSLQDEYQTGLVGVELVESGGTGTAVIYAPSFGLFNQTFPLTLSGNDLVIGDPATLGFTGTVVDDTVEGECWQQSILIATWHIDKSGGAGSLPGPAPGPACDDLPPMICIGFVGNCGDIIPFEPEEDSGYINYPVSGETWENQVYSYIRRDLYQLIRYATAKVACKTAGWNYGYDAPLGLGDMSEADGSTPGTSTGSLRHPAGTHEDGREIDTGYYQLYTSDNLLRSVGDHYVGISDVYHLVAEPYILDLWRTAYFIACLSEHPGLRVIGVDGQVGLLLEPALDDLVTYGWISAELRASIPLAYEIVDQGGGWFLFHHHHMHIGMEPELVDVADSRLAEAAVRLSGCGPNPFNPSTTISYELLEDRVVDLIVFDARGQRVRTLLRGVAQDAGHQRAIWDGRDDDGRQLASGVYVYRIKAGNDAATGRAVLVK